MISMLFHFILYCFIFFILDKISQNFNDILKEKFRLQTLFHPVFSDHLLKSRFCYFIKIENSAITTAFKKINLKQVK